MTSHSIEINFAAPVISNYLDEKYNKKLVYEVLIGKKHALKKYDQFALNTSCFWRITGSNITPIEQFHEIFVTRIMNKLIY